MDGWMDGWMTDGLYIAMCFFFALDYLGIKVSIDMIKKAHEGGLMSRWDRQLCQATSVCNACGQKVQMHIQFIFFTTLQAAYLKIE